jgi:hypothetical protein
MILHGFVTHNEHLFIEHSFILNPFVENMESRYVLQSLSVSQYPMTCAHL